MFFENQEKNFKKVLTVVTSKDWEEKATGLKTFRAFKMKGNPRNTKLHSI